MLSAELRQVLKALALNRQPGWNFPGNFLEISFDEVEKDHARLSVEPGPHCVDANGHISLGVVSVLADIGMTAAMRKHVGLAARIATVSMTLQFTGAPFDGRLETRARFDGFFQQASRQQGLARVRIFAGDTLVCTANGSFLSLGTRDGINQLAPLPMRRRGEGDDTVPLAVEELIDLELKVYTRALDAIKPGPLSFIERFWGLLPQSAEQGATCDFTNGLHVGNRVGHTQGGLTLALAATTAKAALGDDWRLLGIAASYVSPGTGPFLKAATCIVHRGGLTAVLRTRVTDSEGRLVLDATTNHSRGR